MREPRPCGRCTKIRLDESEAGFCPDCLQIQMELAREVDRRQVELLRAELKRRRLSISGVEAMGAEKDSTGRTNEAG